MAASRLIEYTVDGVIYSVAPLQAGVIDRMPEGSDKRKDLIKRVAIQRRSAEEPPPKKKSSSAGLVIHGTVSTQGLGSRKDKEE